MERSFERAFERAWGQPVDRSGDEVAEQRLQQPADRWAEPAVGQSPQQPVDRSGERIGDPAEAHSPQPDVVIRWAVYEDIARLERLSDIWELRETNLRAFDAYRSGRLLWLIADVDGVPVGTVWGELFPEHDRSGATVHIVSFRVDDAYQNRGIGSRLLQTVEEEAKKRGRRRATLFVAQDNEGAIRLYRRFGYEIVGTRASRFDYRDPAGRRHSRVEDQFVMAKSLS